LRWKISGLNFCFVIVDDGKAEQIGAFRAELSKQACDARIPLSSASFFWLFFVWFLGCGWLIPTLFLHAIEMSFALPISIQILLAGAVRRRSRRRDVVRIQRRSVVLPKDRVRRRYQR
jgi:hypothetical protein